VDVGVVGSREDVVGGGGQACYRLDVARRRGDLPPGAYLAKGTVSWEIASRGTPGGIIRM
jgi:hypothetical protein